MKLSYPGAAPASWPISYDWLVLIRHRPPQFLYIYSTVVEIHCSRGAPLKDYNGGLQKNEFFSISSLWWLWSWNTPEMNESRSHDGTFIFYRFKKFWSSKKLENSKVENFESKIFKKNPRNPEIFNWKSMKIDFQNFRDFQFSLISNWKFTDFWDFVFKFLLSKFSTFECSNFLLDQIFWIAKK